MEPPRTPPQPQTQTQAILAHSATPPPSSSAIDQSTPSHRKNLKWYSSIQLIFNPSDHLVAPESKERFYLDLYLLKPDKTELKQKLDGIGVHDLLGIFKENLNDLIAYGIRCMKDATHQDTPSNQQQAPQPQESHQSEYPHQRDESDIDQIRLFNALETLSVVFKTIITKEGFENVNIDLMTLTAGSIENSDPIFSDFVYSIDSILSDQSQSLRIRHRTLQLALSVVSGVNQGSINAYFLRRDLFNTIASLIANPSTVSLIFDSVLLLDLLANFRRFESRNPYLLRMEDYVDEKSMERIISLTILALEDLTVAYRDIYQSDKDSSVMGSVLKVLTNPLSKAPRSPGRAISQAFDSQPGRPACILLPIYDLLCSNTTFFNVLVCSQLFWETFLSFSSHLLSHASSNTRSELYARLVLVILIYLAEEGQNIMCGKAEECQQITVAFCRDRQPALGHTSNSARVPLAAMLDCAVLYLRHNLQRKLKIDTHVVCLRLIHQLLFCLQSNQVRLEEFEWGDLWRAIFSLGSRIGSRIDELKDVQDIDRLAQQILDILSFAAIWSEVLFKDNLTTSILYFEILRSEETIKNLITVANISSSANSNNMNVNNGNSIGKHSNFINGSSNLGVSTIESVKNLNTILSKSKWILEQNKKKSTNIPSFNFLFSVPLSSKQPQPQNTGSSNHSSIVSSAEDCLNLLQHRLNEIGLIDSASLENHLRKYSEKDKMKDLQKFIGLVPQDVFQLMVL